MLNSLKIQNFQSHKKSFLKFVPGTNVIIGRSDSGKSAIKRALALGTQNQPSGTSFCSWWGGDTDVTIKNNSDTIRRIRGKSKNQYFLNDIEFKAFGQTVPEEIKAALQISDINIQGQFDSPFLLTESAGEVAKHFNKLANLDKIDSSQAFIKSKLAKLSSNKKTEEANIEKYTENLKKYTNLEKLEIEVEVLEQIKNDHLNLCKNVQKITSLQTQIEATEKDIELLSPLLALEKPIDLILGQFEALFTLKSSITQLEVIQAGISAKNKVIEKAKNFIELECQVDAILKTYQLVENIKKKQRVLTQTNNNIEENFKKVALFKKELVTLEEILKEQMPDICPLCNQKIK